MAAETSNELPRLFDAIGADSFAASFVFGMIVIALYANKRLGELITPPKGEEYDFTRMVTLSTMVGRDVFYRAYFYYVALLEFFYLFICTSRPLVSALVDGKTDMRFDGPSWPLGAALLVVGVLPATPIVAQLETSLRRFAHSLAQIPDDFFGKVTALSTSDIEEMASKTPQYQEELELFRKISNLLAILGFPEDECARMARKCLSVKLFHGWTVGGKDIWSLKEYERYSDIFDLLKPKSETLQRDVAGLVRVTERLVFVGKVLAANPGIELRNPLDSTSLKKLVGEGEALLDPAKSGDTISQAERTSLEEAKDSWIKKAEECDVAGRRLIALFSIIARNDRRAMREFQRKDPKPGVGGRSEVFSDPVLRELCRMLRTNSPTSEPWYNSMLLSGLAAIICCTLGLWIYLWVVDVVLTVFATSLASTLSIMVTSAKESLGLAMNTSFEFSLSFLFAGLTALFIRSVKTRDETWLAYRGIHDIPVSTYLPVFACSTVAAFLPSVISYVGYYLFKDQGAFQTQQPDVVLQSLLFRLKFSTVWGLVATIFCAVIDIVSEQNVRMIGARFRVLTVVAVLLLGFIVMLLTDGYSLQSRNFWHRLVGITLVTGFGIAVFATSISVRRKLLVTPNSG
ncbi:hypothetical protein IE4872_PD01684 (plasmid) [Rhizobium gallicum]|uniref:Uncharacterized protein n=1 Tax=Rhizobium gallicum TaxID=56730 RepID=A0A1L5NWE4_9HYPH|nr:hypothetical protein [Rhizobium gallicum]APO72205.1 hypothetical protein IE4872_PD01684 [Rhizobium gallicum]